jgi:hypothetical protein
MSDRRAYFRDYKKRPKHRAYVAEFRAQRRARGLCIDCAEISVRFLRCVRCRCLAQKFKKRRREATRENRVTVITDIPTQAAAVSGDDGLMRAS